MSDTVPADRPDVLALPLEEAERQLQTARVTVDVVETRPPRGDAAGARRVVQQRWEGDRVRLVVTYERYDRPAPAGAGR